MEPENETSLSIDKIFVSALYVEPVQFSAVVAAVEFVESGPPEALKKKKYPLEKIHTLVEFKNGDERRCAHSSKVLCVQFLSALK